MTDNALAALKAAYEASSKGEWDVSMVFYVYKIVIWDGQSWKTIIADLPVSRLLDNDAEQEANAAFIVAAHTHVPALLAEVERATHNEKLLMILYAWLGQWMVDLPKSMVGDEESLKHYKKLFEAYREMGKLLSSPAEEPKPAP